MAEESAAAERAPAGTSSRVGRDGVALMFSTAAAAASNLLFWVVAARAYPAASVGQAASEVAAFTMLAGFAQLNLLGVFVRFLASAGSRVLRFLTVGYAGIAVSALALGGGFLLLGFGSGFFVGADAWERGAFVAAVLVFAIFVVQDGILTAFAKAPWVPVENLSVALVKLGLLGLVIPALLPGQNARQYVVAAWQIPTAVAVVVVTVVVFRRLAPREARLAAGRSTLPPRRALASFVVAEYANSLVSNVVTYLPPLLVLQQLGAVSAAYFNVPWLIILSTQTLLWNIGMSLMAEATRHPDRLVTHLRHTFALGAAVVVGWPVVLFAGAPFILRLQGQDYAAAGTTLLRLLALSFPFTAVIILYSVLALLRRRIWQLVLLNGSGAAVLLVSTTLVTSRAGIGAVGLVYLLVQAALSLIVLPSLVARLRRRDFGAPETAEAAPDDATAQRATDHPAGG